MPSTSAVPTLSDIPPLHHRSASTPIKLASSSTNTSAKDRFLSDYISKDRFETIRDNCAKVYDSMQDAFLQLNQILASVGAGAEDLLVDFASNNLDDLEDCEKDSIEACSRVESVVALIDKTPDQDAQADLFSELSVLEQESRERLLYLVARKNAATRSLIGSLQQIAVLQSDLSATPPLIKQLDVDLKTRCDPFKHLARLMEMLPAYVGTVVELVRRRTFGECFTSAPSVRDRY